ncbi:MAG TPA: 30S ribosomal protein S20 [Candidatus Saccharimonadales bacterium]|jgi:small subunit ribosomal protein S20
MPIIKSAKKRVRTAEKAAIRNSKTKRTLKTALKAFHKAITGGEKSADTHAAAQSNIDKAAKKGLIHKNKAARQKAQLAKKAKDAGAAAPVKKAAAKKPAASKAAPKVAAKAPAKKPAAAKKPVAKKPAAKK